MSATGRPRRDSSVDQLLAERCADGSWPGAVYVAGRTSGEPTIEGAVGSLALEPTNEPTRPEFLYDCASLTKPLVLGAVALALEAAGALDLDEPRGDVLPELARADRGAPSITDLLAHRAGFVAWHPLYRDAESPKGVLDVIAALDLAYEPGTSVTYSCAGSIAASIAIERATGAPLATLFEERVAGPLRLPRDSWALGSTSDGARRSTAPTERGRAREAELAEVRRPGSTRRHDLVPGRDMVLRGEVHDGNARFIGASAGNAGLFATARTVYQVASALARGADPFGSAAAARIERVIARGHGDARTFAFQSGEADNAPAGALGPTSFGHTGFTGTSVWISREHDIVAVLLTNRVHPVYREAPIQAWRREFHGAALAALRGDRE